MKRFRQVLLLIVIVLVSPLFWPQMALSSPAVQATRTPADIFLPFLQRPGNLTISGQAFDSARNPLSGVMISAQNGKRAVTDQNGRYELTNLSPGEYALAAQSDNYVFDQTLRSVTLSGQNQQVDFFASAVSAELIQNGGFEDQTAWIFPVTEYRAGYTTAASHSGARAARTGIENQADNRLSYSSARQQVTIPAGVESAILRVWLYPWSGEAALAAQIARSDAPEFGAAATLNDAQYVLILDPAGPGEADDRLIETLMWTRSDARVWSLHQFDVSKYAGQTIKIQIGTYNDGVNGVTGMYVDDVSLETSDTVVTPPPGPTPIPPAGCTNPVVNSGFEFSGGWNIPITAFPAGYSTVTAHSGSGSMRTGIVNAGQNIESYSDAYQVISIPASAASAKLKFWFYTQSSEQQFTAQTELPVGMVWGQSALASDRQYMLILDPVNFTILESLTLPANTNSWHNREMDLAKYRGKTIRIQFGTFNNGSGGISAMYVDDLVVDVCTSGSTPAPATPTPAPTGVPGICSERVANNSFESNAAWEIPATRFTAGYSNEQAHSGVRSMRAGILHAAHNRFSYSDAAQMVTIPSGTRSAQLTLWTYAITGEPEEDLTFPQPTGRSLAVAAEGADVQYLLILDRFGHWIDTLIWQRSNSQTWTQHVFDLTRYAGQTIQLQFGVYNDGLNGTTALYVDDVTLQACP